MQNAYKHERKQRAVSFGLKKMETVWSFVQQAKSKILREKSEFQREDLEFAPFSEMSHRSYGSYKLLHQESRIG